MFLTMLPKYPFKSPASSLFLCFILSNHWLVRVRDVNPITSTPKSQWTLTDSVSERTVSLDSHSFWGISVGGLGRGLLSNIGQF